MPQAPDSQAMAAAIRAFLAASGAGAQDPHLAQTPERVADAWAREFLDGYGQDPEACLGAIFPASGGPLTIAGGIEFVSMCPHHLLPCRATAAVAYLPGEAVAGFGALVRSLECLAHRLILQEELTRQWAGVITRVLKPRGLAIAIAGRHDCLALRGPKQRRSWVITYTAHGALENDTGVRADLLRTLPRGRSAP